MANGQATVDAFVQQIHDTEGVLDSTLVFVNGEHGRLNAAVQLALANGATAEQLKPVTDELAVMKSKSDAVAAAVAANS